MLLYIHVHVCILFSLLVFWTGNFFLIAPFPDHCLLVPFLIIVLVPHCQFSFPHDICFWNVNVFLISPVPDNRLLLPFHLSDVNALSLKFSFYPFIEDGGRTLNFIEMFLYHYATIP